MITQEGSGHPHEPESSIPELQTASPDQLRDLTTQAVDLLATAIELTGTYDKRGVMERGSLYVEVGPDENGNDVAIYRSSRRDGLTLARELMVFRHPEYGVGIQLAETQQDPNTRNGAVCTRRAYVFQSGVASSMANIAGQLHKDGTLPNPTVTEKTMPPVLGMQVKGLTEDMKGWKENAVTTASQSWLGRICRRTVRRQD